MNKQQEIPANYSDWYLEFMDELDRLEILGNYDVQVIHDGELAVIGVDWELFDRCKWQQTHPKREARLLATNYKKVLER